MGTHHTLINGTAYAIKGGTDLIAGTSYQIGGGRTLVDGTAYEIGFSDGLTWMLKNTYTSIATFSFNANFESNGTKYRIISGYTSTSGGLTKIMYTQWQAPTTVYEGYWMDEAYRTITFDEPPTGALLTWLQANAVQQ